MQRVRVEFPEAAWRHRHTLSVRVGDMNHAAHLGHDALITLLQEARAAALAELGARERDIGGYPGVVADLMVQYQSEAHWPDVLDIETAIPVPEDKGLMIFQRIVKRETQRQVASARITLLLVDPARDGKVVAPPESFLARLSEAGDD